MNHTSEIPVRALQLFEPDSESVYTIESAANLAHVGRHRILVYYKRGLLSPIVDPEIGGYYFNDDGIRALRRIQHLHEDLGVNLAGIKIIFDLLNEVERLRNEIRFLRER
jgi:MerR family transcriptional regulator, heat shock protein HspR